MHARRRGVRPTKCITYATSTGRTLCILPTLNRLCLFPDPKFWTCDGGVWGLCGLSCLLSSATSGNTFEVSVQLHPIRTCSSYVMMQNVSRTQPRQPLCVRGATKPDQKLKRLNNYVNESTCARAVLLESFATEWEGQEERNAPARGGKRSSADH